MRFTFLTLLAAFAVFSCVAAQASVPLRTHSISMPYIDDDLQNRWFDFGGDAIINTNRHIRLTNNRQSQQGYLWSRLPLTAANFEIEFEFDVDGQSGHLYGDGFAMWLTKDRATVGPVFGSADRFEGLGIFFDTYDNERAHRHTFPYVSSMLGDGVTSYDNSKDGSTTQLAGCEANFRSKSFPTKAKLTYYKNNYMQLDLIWREEDEWTECFKAGDVKLPEQLYLGFSAHTGEVTDNHDIVSVVTRTLIPKKKEVTASPPPPKSSKRSGGFWSFMLKLLAAGALVGVLFIAYRMYDNNNRMKRF
ncbi:legume-like lectin family-domain-containing protein [Syncephalastrum racemosum]|uniref:Legume-like lectin family-domain-containing protein n=1 Tax=Syncephalastrum racemosum TaxID=13706 RepID=A0A1X2H4Q2_SYNRA|nr:legume-like lectin family-domain-containing protein [Syncephalastrum racemosum]